MQIAKWGNSLAVRIPADMVRALGLKEGDDVQLRALEPGELVLISERERRDELLDRMRSLARPFPTGYKFDREEANAR